MQIARASIKLKHASRDPIEQVAIMADDDQSAPIGGQPVLEPGNPLEIEVVGRLVEDQQLAWGGQRGGQRHALGLTSGQLAH